MKQEPSKLWSTWDSLLTNVSLGIESMLKDCLDLVTLERFSPLQKRTAIDVFIKKFEQINERSKFRLFHVGDLNKLKKIYNIADPHRELDEFEKPNLDNLKDDLSFVEYVARELKLGEDVQRDIDELRRLLALPDKDLKQYILEFDDVIDFIERKFTGRTEQLDRLSTWATEEHKTNYLVFGPPGVGKTALAAKLFTEIRDNEDVIAAAHFAREGDVNDKASRIKLSLYTQVAKNLGWQIPANLTTRTDIEDHLQVKVEELSRKNLKRVVFIIDGFDELPKQEQYNLWKEIHVWQINGMHIALFSRRVELHRECIPDIEMGYDDEGNISDIREYATREVHLLQENGKQIADPELLLESLMKIADGQFQHMDFLLNGLKYDKIIMDEIESLSPDLIQNYSQTMRRLEESFLQRDVFIDKCVPILTLLTIEPSGVTVSQLAAITGIELKWVQDCLNQVIQLLRVTRSAESGLETTAILKQDKVSLCHNTVRDFLLSYEYTCNDMPRIAALSLEFALNNQDVTNHWPEMEYYAAVAGQAGLTHKLFAETDFLHHLMTGCQGDRDEFYYRIRNLVDRSLVAHPNDMVTWVRSYTNEPETLFEESIKLTDDNAVNKARLYLFRALFVKEFYALTDNDSETMYLIGLKKPQFLQQWVNYFHEDLPSVVLTDNIDKLRKDSSPAQTHLADSKDFLREFFAQDDADFLATLSEYTNSGLSSGSIDWKVLWRKIKTNDPNLWNYDFNLVFK